MSFLGQLSILEGGVVVMPWCMNFLKIIKNFIFKNIQFKTFEVPLAGLVVVPLLYIFTMKTFKQKEKLIVYGIHFSNQRNNHNTKLIWKVKLLYLFWWKMFFIYLFIYWCLVCMVEVYENVFIVNEKQAQ